MKIGLANFAKRIRECFNQSTMVPDGRKVKIRTGETLALGENSNRSPVVRLRSLPEYDRNRNMLHKEIYATVALVRLREGAHCAMVAAAYPLYGRVRMRKLRR